MFEARRTSRRVVLAAAALALWVYASAPAPSAQSRSDSSPHQNSVILVGRVVEGLTDVGVAEATLRLRRAGSPLTERVLTDADGNFVFFGLSAGSYSLDATAVGYHFGTYGRRRLGGRPRSLVVPEGVKTVQATVSVWKAAAISGTVVDETGNPVAGVEVVGGALSPRGGRLRIFNVVPNVAWTDDRGMFRLFDLVPGQFVVSVPAVRLSTLAPGSADPPTSTEPDSQLAYTTVFYPGIDVPDASSELVVADGEERRGVNIVLSLRKTHRLSGRLVDSYGGSLQSVPVQLIRPDDRYLKAEPVVTAWTTSDGSFVFRGVPEGTYVLQVLDAGPRSRGFAMAVSALGPRRPYVVTEIPSDAETRWAAVPVSVSGSINDLVVPLKRGLRIKGQLVFKGSNAAAQPTGDRMTRIRVSAVAPDGRVPPWNTTAARVDATGRFQTPGLPSGSYLIQINHQLLPPGWALESLTLDGRDVLDRPIPLADRDVTGLIATLTDRVSDVAGRVLTADGAPDVDATVLLFPSDPAGWIDFGQNSSRMREVRVDDDGSFSTRGLPPGQYLAVAVKDEDADDWQLQATLQRLSRVATRFDIAVGDRRELALRTSRGR